MSRILPEDMNYLREVCEKGIPASAEVSNRLVKLLLEDRDDARQRLDAIRDYGILHDSCPICTGTDPNHHRTCPVGPNWNGARPLSEAG